MDKRQKLVNEIWGDLTEIERGYFFLKAMHALAKSPKRRRWYLILMVPDTGNPFYIG